MLWHGLSPICLAGRTVWWSTGDVPSDKCCVLCLKALSKIHCYSYSTVYSRVGGARCCKIRCHATRFRCWQSLYLSCRTNDAHLSVAALERCVTATSRWMSANRLKLNMEKTEWLWTGTSSNLDPLPKSALQVVLGNDTIDVADAVRDYGFLEYSSHRIYVLTSVSPPLSPIHYPFERPVRTGSVYRALVGTTKCFFQLRQLRRVRRSLHDESVATLVYAYVMSRIDYYNGLLAGAPNRHRCITRQCQWPKTVRK